MPEGIKLSNIPFAPEPPPPAAPVPPLPVLNKSWQNWDVVNLLVGTSVVPAIVGHRPIDRAVVLANSGNGGIGYIAPSAPSASKGIPLEANQSVTLFAKDLNDIKISATIANQTFHIWYYWDEN